MEATWHQWKSSGSNTNVQHLADDTGFVVESHFFDEKRYFLDSLWRVEKLPET